MNVYDDKNVRTQSSIKRIINMIIYIQYIISQTNKQQVKLLNLRSKGKRNKQIKDIIRKNKSIVHEYIK